MKKTDSHLAARCAAIASLGAGAIHVAVTPMHWRDWLPSGVFFAALATFQLLWAFIAWARPGAVVLAAGIAANVGAAGLWVMSCLTGPPLGPSAGRPEAVNAAGIAVLLLQCYVVMGAAWAWSRKYEPEEVSGFGRALVLMGANTIVAGAVTVGLVGSLQGHHHHGGVAEAQGDHHEAHMDADHDHMDGHMSPMEGQPVTDMALHAEEGHRPPAAIPPAPAEVSQSAPPVVASSAKPAPVQPQPATADSDHDDDVHQHHHDD